METPIFDFVRHYQQSGTARFHMPGHKGVARLGCEPLDITEIAGADNLQHPELGGIIARSEQHATALFGSAQTYYSAGGSSACISAMLYLVKLTAPTDRKGRILAGRNAHKVFLQACGLLGITPEWLYPDASTDITANSDIGTSTQQANNQGLCGCAITPTHLTQTLSIANERGTLPMAVYLTSPDYLGNLTPIAALSAICAQYEIPLLVDNAHGAYLKFLPDSLHPLDLGAAMCCDSAHKTLPVLTGGAYLHLGTGIGTGTDTAPLTQWQANAKQALSLFSSTSPSYLILQSLDLCNAYLAESFRAELAACIATVATRKQTLRAHGYCICDGEPLKIVIDCRGTSFTDIPQGGESLADALRTHGIEVEFADPDFLVCMITPQNTAEEIARLEHALCTIGITILPHRTAHLTATHDNAPHAPTPHESACNVQEALYALGETIAVTDAIGRICRLPTVSCPPAIPIVVSGERITEADIALFQYYGIDMVDVICD